MKRRKGFTLIELLAVIVILAIIAVIATPIIVSIIEDSRKAAFERSVEGIMHAIDLDFGTQEVLSSDPYVISDGQVNKTLKTPIKNIDGFSGTIKYDEKGNSTYAIHNKKWCMIKDSNGNVTTIDYVDGECELAESGSNLLTMLQQLVPNEGDKVTSMYTNIETNSSTIISTDEYGVATEETITEEVVKEYENQLVNLGKYGIRYQGKFPNNYIYFNCSDYENQSSSTCETWRIIGIVDGLVKIIKDESIGKKSYSRSGTSNWETSDLQLYLNGEYLTSLTTKNSNTTNMIADATWFLRSHSSSAVKKDDMYNLERTTGVIISTEEIEYVGPLITYPETLTNTKIGLMYPSDYGFAAFEDGSDCTADTTLRNYAYCNNWLNTSTYKWTITPALGGDYPVFSIYPGGYLTTSGKTSSSVNTYPTLYLKENVLLKDGNGTKENPYQITQ